MALNGGCRSPETRDSFPSISQPKYLQPNYLSSSSILEDHLIGFGPGLSDGGHPDGGLVLNRAFIFTDAAPHTLVWIDPGHFQHLYPAFPVFYFHHFKPYGLGGCGADFFTDNTLRIHGPGQTGYFC